MPDIVKSSGLFIGMPVTWHLNVAQTTVSLFALAQQLTLRGVPSSLAAWSFPDLVDNRNLMLTVWYDCHPQASHFLFVDSDMQFEPDLVLDMIEADKPLVGCLYPKKRLPIEWVGSALVPSAEPEGNLLELEGLGCGVMLIRRDCVDRMLMTGQVETEELGNTAIGHVVARHGGKRIIQAFDKLAVEGRRLSEDFSFCHRHRSAGGKVYAVTNHVVCHVGMHQFAARYSDVLERQSGSETA